jgi:hypothetical protein
MANLTGHVEAVTDIQAFNRFKHKVGDVVGECQVVTVEAFRESGGRWRMEATLKKIDHWKSVPYVTYVPRACNG